MLPLIIVSSTEKKAEEYIEQLLVERQVAPPDVIHIFPQTKEIGIAQIRELRKDVAISHSRKSAYILHQFDHASRDAQNAFLKTLEEHQSTILFVLVVQNLQSILSTITSRCNIIKLNQKAPVQKQGMSEIEEFLTSKDMKILAKFSEKKSDEELLSLLDTLLSFFRERLSRDSRATNVLKELLITRIAVGENNVSLQTGLDHIFLYIKHVYS